jgi:hypothetical protein
MIVRIVVVRSFMIPVHEPAPRKRQESSRDGFCASEPLLPWAFPP